MTIQNLRTQIRRKGDFVDVGIAGVMLTYLAAAFGAAFGDKSYKRNKGDGLSLH